MESFKDDNIIYSVEFPFLSQEKRCVFPFKTRKEEIGIRNDWDNFGKTDNKLSLKSREPSSGAATANSNVWRTF